MYLILANHFTIFFVDQVNLIEQIAIEVDLNNFEEMQNSTITAVDFASQKISFDVEVTKTLQSNQEFHKLTELMVDIVGNQIRKKVRHLFNLKGRLWIARYVENKGITYLYAILTPHDGRWRYILNHLSATSFAQ